MKPIEYPSKGTKEFADLVNDYVSIFATDLADKVTKRGRKRLGLESKWKNWKRKYGCIRVLNNSVADLLTMDFEDLALFYEAFLRVCSKKRFTPKSLHDLQDIFKYTNKYDSKISAFFKRHADELKIYTCHYCDMAYINVYTENGKGVAKSQFDIDHFLPKGKCPPVALSLFNFVPSCPVCNERIKREDLPNVNLNDLKFLSPSSFAFDLPKRIKVKLGHLTSPRKDFIYFVAKYPYDRYVDFFHLQERYDYHKIEALRLEQLKKNYSRTQIAQIAKCLHRAEKEVKEDIFNQRYMQNSHRCFAKFTIDILNR